LFGGAEAIDGDDGGGVLQSAVNPLMLLRPNAVVLQLIPLPASDHAAFQADDEGSIPFTRSNKHR